jgi:hypothetical protein
MEHALILSVLINIVGALWLIGIYAGQKIDRNAVLRSAYEYRPLYVVHPGVAIGQDGQEHPISVPELAKLYKLPVDKWIPINPKFDRTEWKKVYGEQAIHLYPLPHGMEYSTYLSDVLHNGIRPDMPPMVIEAEKHPMKLDPRQYSTIPSDMLNTIGNGRILIKKWYDTKTPLLNNNYLRVGTRVYAYDHAGSRIGDQYYRVIQRPVYQNVDDGYTYTFNQELPINTVELRIARS